MLSRKSSRGGGGDGGAVGGGCCDDLGTRMEAAESLNLLNNVLQNEKARKVSYDTQYADHYLSAT